MEKERVVRLFRNGRNQAVRIPRDFEMEGTQALIRKEGDRLILEPAPSKGLLAVLADMEPLPEADRLPDTDKGLLPPDDITL